MSELIWISILVFCLVQVLFSYFRDAIVNMIFLKNSAPIEGTIVYFDECYIHESRFDLSIVESDKSKKIYVVSRGAGDKIGDKIKIVTDGKITTRKDVCKKFEMESYTFLEITCIVIAIIFLRNGEATLNQTNIIFTISVFLFTTLLDLVAYTMQMKQIKKKIGMYNR